MINLYWFVSTSCDWSCWRNIVWPKVFLYSLSRKLHASPNVCHFQMRSCMENCAISWREIVKNTLYIKETIPYRTETRKKWILRYWFSGFSSKISMILSSTTRRSSFTYISWLMWSPLRDRMMHNVQSPSLKTSDEEFVKKITDFRDYCRESASWAERTDWINVRCINSAILSRKWLLYQTNNKTLHCWISHRCKYHNKL